MKVMRYEKAREGGWRQTYRMWRAVKRPATHLAPNSDASGRNSVQR